MVMSSILVSIITPVYNSEAYLKDAIDSVVAQTFKNWEMLIVDDGSIDGSWRLLKSIAKNEKRIILKRLKKNSGAGIARNTAIKAAKGEFIAFLDSDDLWHPEKLNVQINLMSKNKWLFSHTSYGYISESGEKIKSTFHVSDHLVDYFDLLKKTEISCLTAVYNQKEIGKYYMSEHRKKQDYALWLSILNDGIKSYPINNELAYYRQRPDSTTSNKGALIIDHLRFLRETQSINIFRSLYYTIHWMVNGFIRYYIK
jgi:teichuronic acid biosynthesis glycosyltransferase TuaG